MKQMEKVKKFFADKGMLFALGGALLLCILASMMINEVLDYKYDKQIYDRQYEELIRSLEESGLQDSSAEDKGLNPYTYVWQFDIEFLRDDFLIQYTEDEYEEYGKVEDWNNGFNKLILEINESYISDEDIYQKVKEIVPEPLFHFVPSDYMKGMKILRRDLIK